MKTHKGMEGVVTSDPSSNTMYSSWNMIINKDNKKYSETSSSSTLPNLIMQVTTVNP